MKADYSSEIAEYILQREGPDRVPSLLQDLFFNIATEKTYSITKLFVKETEEKLNDKPE